jgi:DNA-binding NarL/FixJ family response regulator
MIQGYTVTVTYSDRLRSGSAVQDRTGRVYSSTLDAATSADAIRTVRDEMARPGQAQVTGITSITCEDRDLAARRAQLDRALIDTRTTARLTITQPLSLTGERLAEYARRMAREYPDATVVVRTEDGDRHYSRTIDGAAPQHDICTVLEDAPVTA